MDSCAKYIVDDMPGIDLVGLRIRNTENIQDVVGISFRRWEKLKPDVVQDMLSNIIHSDARFGLTDRPEVHLENVRMPSRNGRMP
jgi:hypothetical protein